ncbi:MAG: hypothetical protein A3B68_04665 [Candidatus Melainabacteria bacterium RIFCSPHIGHO2_02_FULL_34_12]|nr:MAG: hypothetical protein A3B68_04665 [Candidatus Melainabacteria bacterium RIFCSPHIGHO2_02_FULL_34_12]
MFKIRTLHISDFLKLKEYLKEDSNLSSISSSTTNKIACILQSCIPINLRFVPSIHIAVEGKNILGFVSLKCLSKSNNCWQIEEVFVLDQERNKGVGEELLRYVLSVYGSEGIEHFLAEVDSQNIPAISLFHECGFRRYAKVAFYEKELTLDKLESKSFLDKDFILRAQIKNDMNDLEKLELSTIPSDLRPALGRSKDFFKNIKDSVVMIDKSRNLIVGWSHINKLSTDNYLIELKLSPGWTHLYEGFLNTIIYDYITCEVNKIKLTVKAVDYNTELTQTLAQSGFVQTETKELLVRTIWLKVKERKKKTSPFALPRTAPT